MPALRDMRIGTRLAFAFGLIALLMTLMSMNTVLRLKGVRNDMDSLLKDSYVKVKLVNAISEDINLHARLLRNLLIFDSDDQRSSDIKQLVDTRASIDKLGLSLSALLHTQHGKDLYTTIEQERQAFMSAEDVMIAMIKKGDVAQAKTFLVDELRPKQLAFQKHLNELTKYQESIMEDSGESTLNTVQQVTWTTAICTVIGVASAALAGYLTTRSVTRPVRAVVDDLSRVARGDLTVQIVNDRGDEIGQLQAGLSDMVSGLKLIVEQVRTGVDSVTTASGQIAAGNQDLSQRTEQQASSLQQTASSMEQLTATVRQSADTARTASNLAANASAAAVHGGEVVSHVVVTMADIEASSRRIVDIIDVIDTIAFQTNILALNAAVEAARAGEQGRGFAVVAGEVRVLARRSADAAKEIKALIDTSVAKVNAGSSQVTEAGLAMGDIVDQVQKVRDLISEIAGTSGEQSRGIEQVNVAVSQMDQVTQQNAALVEESAAAAASLAHQATALSAAVSNFKTGSPRMPSVTRFAAV